MYYDWSKIDGYNAPVTIVVSRRGLGKTFGKVKMGVENFIDYKDRFIYVVENGEMIKELTKNSGEKFFCNLLKYYAEQDTARKRYYYNHLTSCEIEEVEDEDEDKRKVEAKIIGGTIKINGETAGYILDMNSFGNIKRNNFANVGLIIVDEFISEKLDKTTLDNPRRISSIIQSVLRLENIRIYLLGNTVRLDDPILARMGFKISKYGIYKKYDKYGLFAVLHFVDPNDYTEFAEKHNKSVAGRFASMLGETNEEENKFLSDIPEDRRLREFKYRKNGLSLNIIKNDVIITLKERIDGTFACVPFANKNTTTLYCLTEKEQGFKYGYHIICNSNLKQMILNMLKSNIIFYYSEIEYNQLKIIIKGE